MKMSAMQAEILAKTKDIQHEEWLEFRRHGIGGSDAAAIAGLNPWRSPAEVYLEKVGEIDGPEDNEKMYWGRVLEQLVAEEFNIRTGKKVRRRNAILRHSEYPFMLANVDRLVVGEKAGLECKTASEYAKDQWDSENVPDMYYLQCQHYLAVTGYDRWYLAVLIGGNKFKYYTIDRDEEVIEYLIKIEADFWELVKNETPPEMDGSQSSDDVLKILYPEAEPESEIELPREAEQLLKERDEWKEAMDHAESKKKECENKIKAMLGGAEKGYIGDRKVSWKTVVSNRFDSKTFKKDQPEIYEKYCKQSEYRRFSVK